MRIGHARPLADAALDRDARGGSRARLEPGAGAGSRRSGRGAADGDLVDAERRLADADQCAFGFESINNRLPSTLVKIERKWRSKTVASNGRAAL